MDLNYQPHGAQQAIHDARNKRFRTVCTGRRFGKTLCLAAELMDRGGHEKAGEYGCVAPTYNVAERGIEAFRTIADGFIQISGVAPKAVTFAGLKGLVRVVFLSADNAENIRGYGFEGLVVDEAASIPVNVWNYVLRPTIGQTLGWAVFVSTPKGHNWFYDMYMRGRPPVAGQMADPNEADFASFTFPSNASPFFPAREWAEAERTLPADVFRQEYQAEFLEDSAGVFRNIGACLVVSDLVNSEQYRRDVIIGCDVAKYSDWTVLIAMDSDGRCFDMERFNHLDWPIQKERIVAFARKHHGRVVIDATGVGDPIYDEIRAVLPDVEGFKFTSASKAAIVQRLSVAVEQVKVTWPAAWEVLTAEMQRYEYSIGPTGVIGYSAPDGYHDDCVMALALANHRRWETEGCGNMLRIGGVTRRNPGWVARRRDRVLTM